VKKKKVTPAKRILRSVIPLLTDSLKSGPDAVKGMFNSSDINQVEVQKDGSVPSIVEHTDPIVKLPIDMLKLKEVIPDIDSPINDKSNLQKDVITDELINYAKNITSVEEATQQSIPKDVLEKVSEEMKVNSEVPINDADLDYYYAEHDRIMQSRSLDLDDNLVYDTYDMVTEAYTYGSDDESSSSDTE
jgi:hypothetical protein